MARRRQLRPRQPLRYRQTDYAQNGVQPEHGWVATPGFWHLRASAENPLLTRCGQDLRDGLTRGAPDPGDAVCRRCCS